MNTITKEKKENFLICVQEKEKCELMFNQSRSGDAKVPVKKKLESEKWKVKVDVSLS